MSPLPKELTNIPEFQDPLEQMRRNYDIGLSIKLWVEWNIDGLLMIRID